MGSVRTASEDALLPKCMQDSIDFPTCSFVVPLSCGYTLPSKHDCIFNAGDGQGGFALVALDVRDASEHRAHAMRIIRIIYTFIHWDKPSYVERVEELS